MSSSESQETTEEQPAPSLSRLKTPVLIALVAVGLAVGGGTGATFLGPIVAKRMGKVPQARVDSAVTEDAADSVSEATPGTASPILLLENLVLNPAGSGGTRFLLLTVAIELNRSATLDQLKARDAELRDIILTSLGTKTVEELTDITKRDEFKNELQAMIESRFGKRGVKRLYFPQFVVQ